MKETEDEQPQPIRLAQIIHVPQTAIHVGGSSSIDELMGVTKSGDVMIYNKSLRRWMFFGGQ